VTKSHPYSYLYICNCTYTVSGYYEICMQHPSSYVYSRPSSTEHGRPFRHFCTVAPSRGDSMRALIDVAFFTAYETI